MRTARRIKPKERSTEEMIVSFLTKAAESINMATALAGTYDEEDTYGTLFNTRLDIMLAQLLNLTDTLGTINQDIYRVRESFKARSKGGGGLDPTKVIPGLNMLNRLAIALRRMTDDLAQWGLILDAAMVRSKNLNLQPQGMIEDETERIESEEVGEVGEDGGAYDDDDQDEDEE